MSQTKLMDALQSLESGSKNAITMEDVVEKLNHRGFGTLLLAPAALTLLPTGMIPGVPALCAVLIILIAAQMAVGRKYLWLPSAVRRLSIRRKKLHDALEQARPVIETIDSLTRPRLRIMTEKAVQYAVAVFSLLLAFLIAGLGFIPFVPAILSIPVFFFALGLSARDGLFTIIGFILTAAAALLFPYIVATLRG
jgi:hypothetical protein